MSDLEHFILSDPDFQKRLKSEQIDTFVYFLLEKKKLSRVLPSDIKPCFEALSLPPHTNISSYLAANSKNSKSRKYIRYKDGYILVRDLKSVFDERFSKKRSPEPTDALFPKDILDETRSYIKDIAYQALSCFDFGLYDACSVMLRKLIEVLVIENFERHQLADNIKDPSTGEFFFLSDLIAHLLNEKSWNIGRNAKIGFAEIKKIGDMSAHNRRYFSKEGDMIKIKDSIRVCVQELTILIDYPTWNKEIREKKV